MIGNVSAREPSPDIGHDEHMAVHAHLPPLWEAICATGEHRAQHVGIVMHWMCLGLPREEVARALAYLNTVLHKEIN